MKLLSLIFLLGVSFNTYSIECFEKRIYSTPQTMKITCTENFEGSAVSSLVMWESSQYLTVDYIACPNRDYYIATITHVPSNFLQTFKCDGEIKILKP